MTTENEEITITKRGRPAKFTSEELREKKILQNKIYYEKNKLRTHLNKVECDICHKHIVSASLNHHKATHNP